MFHGPWLFYRSIKIHFKVTFDLKILNIILKSGLIDFLTTFPGFSKKKRDATFLGGDLFYIILTVLAWSIVEQDLILTQN